MKKIYYYAFIIISILNVLLVIMLVKCNIKTDEAVYIAELTKLENNKSKNTLSIINQIKTFELLFNSSKVLESTVYIDIKTNDTNYINHISEENKNCLFIKIAPYSCSTCLSDFFTKFENFSKSNKLQINIVVFYSQQCTEILSYNKYETIRNIFVSQKTINLIDKDEFSFAFCIDDQGKHITRLF